MEPDTIANRPSGQPRIRIKPVRLSDIRTALGKGWADFAATPRYGLFFGAIYALGGLFIVATLRLIHIPWMIIPVVIGFPLIGPFIAVGLYEISRRREAGIGITWKAILSEVFRQRERQLSWMAFVVLFVFWIWVYQVRLLFALFLGYKAPAELDQLVAMILSTTQGALFLGVGTLVGAVIATVLFSLTVIAMPLLLDHDFDFVTAMITSIRAVVENPVALLTFGFVVGLLALLAMLPLFLGLLIVLPVLGHATWHLYRATIVLG
nr:DUF2189 domain-containing protein [uncultured Gellertiella sp.]